MSETRYEIRTSDGRSIQRTSLQSAAEWCRERWGDECYLMHEVGAGELTSIDERIAGEPDGHRVLVWASEAESVNDPGTKAVAEIRKVR